jgi:hypothetical protein
MKADEGEHGHDDHDQPDQIDYAVHSLLLQVRVLSYFGI